MNGISKSLLIVLFALAALFTHGLSSAQQDHMIAPPRPRPPQLKVPAAEKPVELVKYGVQVRISGLESETTTTMVFRNPNARPLAGELEFPLPDGAAVAGYALDVNGRMVDGVAVTREKARVAMETEMRRRVDPGLVEHVRGNFFRTRIYPVPAGGERTVRVTTVAPLALSGADAAYHLPLRRVLLPVLNLEISVAQGPVKPELGGFGDLTLTEWSGQWVARTELENITPGDDLYVRLPKVPAQFVAVEESSGEHFLAIADRPELPAQTAPPTPARLALAWDASGGRSPEAVGRDIAILSAALSAWRDCTMDLVVFRDQPEPVKTFSVASGKADQLLDHLRHLAYDGATNLAALDLSKKAAPHPQVAAWLLFTDGLYTMGPGLPAHGGLPVHVVASDERRDIALQRFLAEATAGQFVDGATLTPESAAALLVNPPATLLRVEAPAGTLADIQYRFLAGAGRAMVYARLLAATAEVTLVYGAAGREIARSTCSVRRDGVSQGRLLARAWAGARAEALSVFPERNADRLLELGQRYGLVTPGTSLLVLENLQQYLRHQVMPPESWPEMREQYLAAVKNNQNLEQGRRLAKIDRVLAWWKARVAWWEKDFPSPRQAAQKPPAPPPADQEIRPLAEMRAPMPAPVEESKMQIDSAPARAMSGVAGGAGADSVAKAKAGKEAEGPSSAIVVKAWDPATPYLAAIKARPQEQAYAAYLAERPAWAQSPAFYLDCAGYLLPRDRALGLRVLSNLAELQIDDAALLRVFAWRLQEAGELDRAIEVLEKVRTLRPEEPQSHRDLALALAGRLDRDGRIDDGVRAAELLNSVITGEWQRFAGIEVVTLMELNRLLAVIERLDKTAISRLDFIDQRLRKLLDLDVRIVLSWDADNTDIDLHVMEPAGEEAFYGHQQTARGGLVSQDVTQGYGPEEYVLRRAPAGTYRIRCNYFASSQQTLVGPATVVATVFTGYGRPTEKRQILTLRLYKPGGQGKEMSDIGEIVIGPDAGAGPAKANPRLSREMVAALAKGATRAEVEAALGPPEREDSGALTVLIYHLGDATELRLGFGPDLLWAREVHPGAEREVQIKEK